MPSTLTAPHPSLLVSVSPPAASVLPILNHSEAPPTLSNNFEPIFRAVRNASEMNQVYRLTHDAYVKQGYCAPQPNGLLNHYPHLDRTPETTVILAVVDNMTVGSNSYTLDGPAGLHVDADFKEECDAIRREGNVLASSWRIVTSDQFRNDRRIVMGLIQETLFQILEAGVETCVFTFHPRHERIYQRLLNMKTIARKERLSDLSNAPAVFMRMEMNHIPARWKTTRPGA